MRKLQQSLFKMSNIFKFLTIVALVPLTAALVSNSFHSESHCIGSLLIGHEDDVGNIHYLSVEGYRTSYPNLMRGYPVLRRNTISTIEIVGNCCWKIYPDRNLRGEEHVIFPGENILYTDFQPLSVRKLECEK